MAQPPSVNTAPRTSPGLANTTAAAGVKRKRTAERKFYAVRNGKTPGIYETWPDCLSQVKGHRGALCMCRNPFIGYRLGRTDALAVKAFQSLHEAQAFMDGKSLPTTNSTGDQKFYAVQKWTGTRGLHRMESSPSSDSWRQETQTQEVQHPCGGGGVRGSGQEGLTA